MKEIQQGNLLGVVATDEGVEVSTNLYKLSNLDTWLKGLLRKQTLQSETRMLL